jgi:hypothetical protein
LRRAPALLSFKVAKMTPDMKVKVGARTYVIKFVKDLTSDDGNVLDGQCTIDESIEINASLNETTRRITILHELLHTMGYYLNDNVLVNDERRVGAIASLIYDILCTNEDLLEYITESIDGNP